MTETPAKARIAPLQPPFPPAIGAMLERWMPPGSAIEPLALFRTLAVHEDLASRMRPLGAGILGNGRVEAREREYRLLSGVIRAVGIEREPWAARFPGE